MYSADFDGDRVTFGTSGMLYRSNKLMYDRQTNTLWNQFTGEPAAGPLVGTGQRLELLPVVTTTWAEWLKAHPDTTVLDQETGIYPAQIYRTESDAQSLYFQYRESPQTMFPVWQANDALAAKGQVLGLLANGQAKAYPLEALRAEAVINDELGGQPLVVVTVGGLGSRAYQRGDAKFLLEEGALVGAAQPDGGPEATAVLTDSNGKLWRMDEAALTLLDDPTTKLPRIPGHNAYWFGWYSFYPQTGVYGGGG